MDCVVLATDYTPDGMSVVQTLLFALMLLSFISAAAERDAPWYTWFTPGGLVLVLIGMTFHDPVHPAVAIPAVLMMSIGSIGYGIGPMRRQTLRPYRYNVVRRRRPRRWRY